MSRSDPLTDELIQATFQRRARQAAPDDLRAGILSLTAGTAQRSAWRRRLSSGLSAPVVRVAWIAIVLLLVALLGIALAALTVGQPRPIRPVTGQLAFIRAGDAYVANGDGSKATLALHVTGVTFQTVAWSPDGTRLAINAEERFVYVLDVLTHSVTLMPGTNAVWSPDGRQLAVLDPATGASAALGPRLRIVDVASGASSSNFAFPGLSELAWSPNGRWIAAAGSGNVERIDLTTGEVVQIDPPSGILDSPREPSWSPDSQHIAFVRWAVDRAGLCEPNPACATDIFVADSDGSNSFRLNGLPGTADRPSWSPDGQWIAFRVVSQQAGEIPTHAVAIAVVRPDGTAQRSVVALVGDAYSAYSQRTVDAIAWSSGSDRLRFTIQTTPTSTALQELTLAGVERSLGVSLDSELPFQGSGSSFDWQAGPTTPP